jgi:nucleotide-binding universal stress UspA family protein
MNEPIGSPPRRILFATDLSARCDRALDRSVALANAWRAELLVVHVLEQPEDLHDARLQQRLPSWRQPIDTATLVREQIRQDMLPATVNFGEVIEQGEPAHAILRTAQSYACELIVTGLARDETLGRFSVGGTVKRLLRRSDVPLLVVRGRARSHYQRIMVGTDFSDCSRHALQTALQLFPDQRLTVFHAYDAPHVRFAGNPGALQQAYGNMTAEVCDDFLQTSGIPVERRAAIDQLVEPGSPRRLIHQYARDRGVQLIVLGTHGRGALTELFIGSTTREILASLPCDALVVRGPKASVERAERVEEGTTEGRAGEHRRGV